MVDPRRAGIRLEGGSGGPVSFGRAGARKNVRRGDFMTHDGPAPIARAAPPPPPPVRYGADLQPIKQRLDAAAAALAVLLKAARG